MGIIIASILMTIWVALVFALLTIALRGPVYLPDALWERVLLAPLLVIGAAAVSLVTRRDAFIGVALVIAFMLGSVMAVEAHTSPARRARYYDVRTLGAVATAHMSVDGSMIGCPGLSLEYDVYIGSRIKQIASPDGVVRVLAGRRTIL